jgi:uncharacterized protein (UPF0261 family)
MAIVVVGMLDEREEALRVIAQGIAERGHPTVLVDISIGTGAIIPGLKADVSPRELLDLAHGSEGIAPVGDEMPSAFIEDEKPSAAMARGLRSKVVDLYASGKLEGIIAIAGMTGTIISLGAMKALPFGVPKLLITSAAAMPAHASQLAEYFALKDITVMHAVVDTVGMNRLVQTLATNGANAISGMVEAGQLNSGPVRPLAAITEFGFCDQGAHFVRQLLESTYEVVSFHANGVGDQAAVELVRQGSFAAVVDMVPAAYGEYLFGGNRASGPDRLDIAVDQPIPYIFCPGGFDMISCGPIDRREEEDQLWISRKLASRKLYVQDRLRVQARTSVDEMAHLGKAVAEKLNLYCDKWRIRVVVPLRGFSSLSVKGGPLFDPEADQAFITALKSALSSEILVIEADTDINNPEFAHVVIEALQEIPVEISLGSDIL